MSTDNVISLSNKRAERDASSLEEGNDPHMEGKARCLACGHEWHAVAPTGMVWMECPSCSLIRGRFVAQVERKGPHWHCHCGNELFCVTPDGIYCPNCGDWHFPFEHGAGD